LRLLLLLGEVDPQDDDHHQEDYPQYAHQHELVATDTVHHCSHQPPASVQVLTSRTQLATVANQPASVVLQLAPHVVTDLEGLVHHTHSVLQLVSGIREYLPLPQELRPVILPFLLPMASTYFSQLLRLVQPQSRPPCFYRKRSPLRP
jgi:hypothetical protein